MSFSISSSYEKIQSVISKISGDALQPAESIASATAAIISSLPEDGLGEDATVTHLLEDLTPGFHGQKTSANYYGFVTGGVLPIAEVADNVVTAFDQNAASHLPSETIVTLVEDAALKMLVDLLELGEGWEGKIFTTGATGSNVLGLAAGREAVIARKLREKGEEKTVGELGILKACLKAGIREVQVLTTLGHSSLFKAASVVGIGRGEVRNLPLSAQEPWKFDLERLESELKRAESEGVVNIIAISAGEVNTGRFATEGLEQVKKIRELSDRYGAWLHVDGAFGIFARALPKTAEFETLRNYVAGLELADSITGDAHKLLNVPYDCGFFFTRSHNHLSSIFQNPNAAYLSTGPSPLPSPLNIGLENSRRFRALPVYSVLVAYGIRGLSELFARQVLLARAIAKFLDESEEYEFLPKAGRTSQGYEDTQIIVLFRAKDEKVNAELVKRINGTKKIYVSGTQWEGRPAVRLAVSTWKVAVERDLRIVGDVLKGILN